MRFVRTSRPRRLTRPVRRRRRRALRIALWTFLAVVLCAALVAGWALNRYVIDHVEIGDVRDYEQRVNAGSSEAPLATFSVPDTVASSTRTTAPRVGST